MDEVDNLKKCLTSFSSWANRLCSKNFSPAEKANIRDDLIKIRGKELQESAMCINKLYAKFGG